MNDKPKGGFIMFRSRGFSEKAQEKMKEQMASWLWENKNLITVDFTLVDQNKFGVEVKIFYH